MAPIAFLPDHVLRPDARHGLCLVRQRGGVVRGRIIEDSTALAASGQGLSVHEVILPQGELLPARIAPLTVGSARITPAYLDARSFTVDAVFVYGTLLLGESNAGVLPVEWVQTRTPAEVAGRLYETEHPYPVMRLEPAGTVRGERVVLRHAFEALGPLDALEGFSGYDLQGRMYHRTLVQVRQATGPGPWCWTYVQGETLAIGPPIEEGDWRAFRLRTHGARSAIAP